MSRALLVLAICLALVGGWLLNEGYDGPRFESATRQEEAHIVPIGTDESSLVTPVLMEFTYGPATTVSIGQASGRVTWLGEPVPLVSGRAFLALDGIERPILLAPQPLWRPLERGASGGDVDGVADLFRDLGLLADAGLEGVTVDAVFVGAVQEFEVSMGWSRTGVFKPEYVLWLPPSVSSIGEFEVALGQHLPAESTLFTSGSALTGATVVGRDGALLELPSTLGSWEFVTAGVPPVALTPSGDLELDLVGLGHHFDTGETTIDGVVQLTEPAQWQTVPAAAVEVAGDGTTCVRSADGRVWQVVVTGSRLGVARILPVLPSRTEVLVSSDGPDGVPCSP
ncbi:MAG: hypothetical protein GY745_09245 [Actinomycetia bacterium]|nr:hypothetical protein [Actinomycetes bacterium]